MAEIGVNTAENNSYVYNTDNSVQSSYEYDSDMINFDFSKTVTDDYSDGFSSDWKKLNPW